MPRARLLVVAAVALVALLFGVVVDGSRVHRHRRPSPATPVASAASILPGGDVDGWALASASANWFSVCVPVSPAGGPAIPPPSSPLPIPAIDSATSAVSLTVVAGKDTSCLAWGYHSDDIDTVGWSYLSIETNPDATDFLQSRAAGYLEGTLCQKRIAENVAILLPGFYPHGLSVGVTAWLNESLNFQTDMVHRVSAVDDYWMQVGGLYLQVQGLFEGYSAAVTTSADALSWFDIFSLQLDVDIGDITNHVGLYSALATPAERERAQQKMADKVSATAEPADTHCSSLIKLLPNNADLLVGHDTWSGFETMLRTFKLYVMPLRSAAGVTTVHMSAYPGFLFSSDDWYQTLPALLTITETSNDIFNPALYALIQPASVGIWARTLVANRMAIDGPSWVEAFSRYNSGTCDNQWIIIDHNKFTAGAPTLTPGLLTISEQMPGMFVTRDMTAHLQETTYWSSFNIPFFNLTYLVSGYTTCPGDAYTCGYYENFRYLLFQQLQSGVKDLTSMQAALLYNDWQSNPLQRGSASYAIASRYDLRETDKRAFGGIDGKITSDSWMKEGHLRVSAYSGPTNQGQTPFCWGGPYPQPKGHPSCFDFKWVQYSTAPQPDRIALQ